jgi:sec-independent protein translocase protein TatA
MPNIGPMELIIVLVIALVVLGPKRLPGLGKQLGTGMREFKESINGTSRDDEDERPRGRKVAAQATLAEAEPTAPPVQSDEVREHQISG